MSKVIQICSVLLFSDWPKKHVAHPIRSKTTIVTFIHFSLHCTSYKYLFFHFPRVLTFNWLYVFLTPTWKPSAVHYIWDNKVWNSFYLTIFLYLPHTLKEKLIQNSCTHVFSFASSHLYMATESRKDIERNNHFRSSVHRRICTKIKMGAADCDFIFSTMSLTKIWYTGMCKIKANFKPDTLLYN